MEEKDRTLREEKKKKISQGGNRRGKSNYRGGYRYNRYYNRNSYYNNNNRRGRRRGRGRGRGNRNYYDGNRRNFHNDMISKIKQPSNKKEKPIKTKKPIKRENKNELLKKAERLVKVENFKEHLNIPVSSERQHTEDVTLTKGTSFKELLLRKELLMGIYEKGFENPSPIQERAIPTVLMGKDVLARAKNGTGKTGAFLIPTLQSIDYTAKYLQAVILVPTRELAMQTSKVAMDLGKYLDLKVMVSTGGTHLKHDIIRLKQIVHLIVATPGRLLDLHRRKCVDLSKIKIVVLDEADKLISDDFKGLIDKAVTIMPKEKQILLFSATFPVKVKNFKDKHMKFPEVINMMDQLTLKGLTQFYAYVEERQKVHCLHTLLKKLSINQCIIFCNSVKRVELLAKKISSLGYSSFYIHANLDQRMRNKIFHDFRTGKCRNLVATDLFTRGIDIDSVNVVINFDFPKNSETYLHRIGRSGRFGTTSIAISFVTYEDRFKLFKIEKELNTEVVPIPPKIDKELYVV